MEEQNKKLFSIILMSVGTLFIVIAGAIFISKTWGYLPEAVKKLILMVVTSGFFTVSYLSETKWNLKRSSIAFYYLGVCFTGFTLFSVMSVFIDSFILKLGIAQIGMLIPIIARFINKKDVLDFILEMLLTDGMTICIVVHFMDTANYMLVAFAYITVILSGFIYYAKKALPELTEIKAFAITSYGLHFVITFFISLTYMIDNTSSAQVIIALIMIIASFSILIKLYPDNTLRVAHSVMTYYCSFCVLLSAGKLLELERFINIYQVSLFVSFMIGMILLVTLKRKELLYISIVWAVFATFMQITLYTILSSSHTYMPYALVVGLALLIWRYIQPDMIMSRETIEMSISWIAMAILTFVSSLDADFARNYGIEIWAALLFVQAAILASKHADEKAILNTVALIITVTTICANPIVYTGDFYTEYIAAILGLGIVLFRYIWYHKNSEVRFIQFGITLIILIYLLGYNFTVKSLPHILILGITTLVMLLVSTYLKNKAYAITSATLLVVIVIYLTRAVWMSIAWWVYLFIAGVVLVFFAIKREKAEK